MPLKQSGIIATSELPDLESIVTQDFPINKNENQAEINAQIFKDPLDTGDSPSLKETLADTFNRDHLVRSTLELNAWATIHYPHKYQLYPLVGDQNEYNTDEELQKALEDETGLDKENQKKLLKYVATVIEVSEFENWLQQAWLNAMVGGRGAFFVEKLKETKKNFIKDVDLYKDTPILFKPLSWENLGQTWIDEDTFRIKEVRYYDQELAIQMNRGRTTERPDFIPIENLFYLTCDDSNSFKNSFGYGNSRLLPLIYLSAARRQATDKDIPEMFTSFWNQTGVLELEDMSEENKKYVMEQIFRAGSIAIVKMQGGAGVRFTPVALKHDGWFMIQYLGLARGEVLRMLRTPDFMLNYDADSRSVVESAVAIWSDFLIAPDRKQVFGQAQNQFFSRLIKIFVDNNKGLDENIVNAVRIRPVFSKISIEDLLSKANSLELLIRRDIVSKRESRNIINLPEKRIKDKDEDKKLSPAQWASLDEAERQLLMETAAKESLLNNPPNPTTVKMNGQFGSQQMNKPLQTSQDQLPTHGEGQAGIKTPKTRQNAKVLASRGAGRSRQA